MKKIVSSLLVCVLLVSTVLVLVSCGGGIDNGTYANKSRDVQIEISGSTLVITKEGVETTYTYEIKDDENNSAKQNIVLTPESGEVSTYSYQKLEDGFAINGIKYTKK